MMRCPNCGSGNLVIYGHTDFIVACDHTLKTLEIRPNNFSPYFEGEDPTRCIDCDYEAECKRFEITSEE